MVRANCRWNCLSAPALALPKAPSALMEAMAVYTCRMRMSFCCMLLTTAPLSPEWAVTPQYTSPAPWMEA